MLRLACAGVLAVAAAAGQDPIGLIRERVAEVTARTPNYTCLETIERRCYLGPGRESLIVDRLRLEVAVVEGREQFSWPGGVRLESEEARQVMGRAVSKSGDFSGFLSCIFGPDSASFKQAPEDSASGRGIRYDYRIPRADSKYTVTAHGVTRAVGFHGSFWVDAETLDLKRVEIDAEELPPELHRSATKLAIDYGMVKVGTGEFLLPTATDVIVVTDSGLENHTATRFSECRQFLAESSISFEAPSAEPAAKKDAAEDELPGGLNLEARLITPIVRKTAATGDAVEAELSKDVKTKSGVAIPKGAVLEGRIVVLETRGTRWVYDVLALRFTALRFGDRRMAVRAVMGRPYIGGFRQLPKGDWLGLKSVPVKH